jgi:hypothetical protein
MDNNIMRIYELENSICFYDIEKQLESKIVKPANRQKINLADLFLIYIKKGI